MPDLVGHEEHALGRGDERLEAQVEGRIGQAATGGARGGYAGVDERMEHGGVGLCRVRAPPSPVRSLRVPLLARAPRQRPELARVCRPVPHLPPPHFNINPLRA